MSTELPPKPNETFFESNLLAAEIRRLTLVGIGACIARLHIDDDPIAAAELLGATGALRQWGIVENLHVLDSDDDPGAMAVHQTKIMSNPVIAAGYVAGQFLFYLKETKSLDASNPAVLNEHTELEWKDGRMIDMRTAPEAVKEYAVSLGTLSGMMNLLDYSGPRARDEALAAGQKYEWPSWVLPPSQ